jgi:hypothetical protein
MCCDFSSLMPAHAICQHSYRVLLIKPDMVFIVVTTQANVSKAGYFHLECFL